MKDHPAVIRYARAIAASSGISHEDLLECGRDAVADVSIKLASGRYDPHKSSLDTYTTTAVYRRMCTVIEREKRQVKTVPLDLGRGGNKAGPAETTNHRRSVGIPDDRTPAPDRGLLLAELIRELPSDARAVVDLVLSDLAGSPIDRALCEGTKEACRKAKQYIRRALGSRLRRGDRAEAAFRAISSMLAEMG